MLISKFVLPGVVYVFSVMPSFACFICDEFVEFNSVTAQCFLENVPTYLAEGEDDAAGRVEVNLTACGPKRGVDSFPSLTRSNSADDTKVKLVYTLETSSVECLAEKLMAQKVTEIVSFNIPEDCAGD